MSERRAQRPYTEVETALLRELFAANYSDIRIAYALGRSPGSVCARRNYLGLYRLAGLAGKPIRASDRPKMQWKQTELEQLASLVEEGRTDGEIAGVLNRPVPSVGGKRRVLGLQSAQPQGRPRSVDATKIDEARARIAAGERVADIAPTIGMTKGTLYWRLRIDHAPSA
jgi:hypothetical protein